MATLRPHGNSGDLTLGSAYNPGEVTGRCQGNGRVRRVRKEGMVEREEVWTVQSAIWSEE